MPAAAALCPDAVSITLSRYLVALGYGTRKEAERIVRQRRVTNAAGAVIGTDADGFYVAPSGKALDKARVVVGAKYAF